MDGLSSATACSPPPPPVWQISIPDGLIDGQQANGERRDGSGTPHVGIRGFAGCTTYREIVFARGDWLYRFDDYRQASTPRSWRNSR